MLSKDNACFIFAYQDVLIKSSFFEWFGTNTKTIASLWRIYLKYHSWNNSKQLHQLEFVREGGLDYYGRPKQFKNPV